ncbi:hypothetical protein [Xanthomonas sacchari]|uniref:hypothetical protein n=1 Tax=Xanthomonas sacchari TaxID=56458 RepID=UPI001FCA29B1|nr:hypothetical protein [Xanthomonas sacchari]
MSVSAILALHDARHSQDRSLAAILALAAEQPDELGALLLLALQRGSPASAYLDVALDLLPDAVLEPVCAEAWRRYRQGESAPLVVRVVELASYQAPQTLRCDWEALLGAFAEGEAQLAPSVWRALPAAVAAHWADTLRAADDAGELARAQALLLAAQADTVAIARRYLLDRGGPSAHDWIPWAGLSDTEQPQPLHGLQPLHLRFGHQQWRMQLDAEPQWRREIWRLHPTWQGGTLQGSARIGGVLGIACGYCDAPLQRLLELDRRFLQEGASGTVTLCLCQACAGGGEGPDVYYVRHGADGLPESASASPGQDVAVLAALDDPLMEAVVGLAAMHGQRWQQQDWGGSNNRQNLSRVGGAPSWVQGAGYPHCRDCKAPMRFVLQLDTILPTVGGDTLYWGNGGMLYVFWCDACAVSAHQWQCT